MRENGEPRPKIDPHRVSQRLELNYCPRCGQALEDAVAFARLRRVCPACGLVVFREHKVAAVVLLQDVQGRVLLVRRAWEPQQGLWSLPGGYVDYDETPVEAAIRECREETGLEIEDVTLLDLYGRPKKNAAHHGLGADVIVLYRARLAGGHLTPADDATDAGFFPLDALPPLAFQSTRRVITALRNQQHRETS